MTNGNSVVEWWTATFSNVVKVDQIFIYANDYAFASGYYNAFKVETKLDENDDWVVCKGPYSLTEPLKPHILRCNAQYTLAKYIRLSISGRGKSLYLQEVRVTGQGKSIKIISFVKNKF